MWSTSIPTGAPSPMASTGRPVPAHFPFLHAAQAQFHEHRGLQHLRPRPRRRRPHWHPAIRRRFQRCRLHYRRRRPGQHGHYVHQRQQGRTHLLAEGKQGSRQLPGLYDGSWDDEANDKTELGNNVPIPHRAPTTRRPAAKTTAPKHPSAGTSRLWAIVKFA